MASVTYKIGGKYDGKGIKSAKKDLSDLATVVKGLAIIKAGQQLVKIANATKSVFVEQNKALTSFNTAVSKSGIELSKLNNLKKELSHGNFIDDDSLNNAMKLGIQMGLNAEQLEKVTKTAVNMASAGVKPLDKAMKELTKTAMTNESEFDAISQRYEGFADAMSNTFSGRNAQWQNSISDLKASIGGIFQGFTFLSQGKFLEPLNKITEWIVNNRNNILKFILNLPSVIKVALSSITNLFSLENLARLSSNLFNAIKESIKLSTNLVFTMIDSILQSIGHGLYAIFEDTKLGELIKNVLSGNGGKEQIDRQRKANEIITQAKKNGVIDSIFKITDEDLEKLGLERVGGDKSNTFQTKREQINYGVDAIKNNMAKLLDTTVSTSKGWKEVLSNFWSDLGDTIDVDGAISQIQDIINNSDLPDELKLAFEGMTFNVEDEVVEKEIGKLSKFGSFMSGSSVVGSSALSGSGEIGSLIQSIMQNGFWGAIATMIAKLLARVEQVSPLFSYFQNILTELVDVILNPESGIVKAIENFIQPFLDGFNAMKDIVGSFFNFIGGILNSLQSSMVGTTMILNKIAPLITTILDLLGIIGNIVGTVGEMLNPILEVVLNVIAPVLDVVMYVIKGIHYLIATIINWIIDIYNAITWGSKVSHISTEIGNGKTASGNSYTTYNPNLSGYATALASTTSGNASYQSAKDIYLNVYFDHSFVNGDGREMALMIRDEIRSAERLGY